MTTTEVVRAAFAAYLAGDRAAAEPLYADDFTFTSPRDDHIDRAAFFEVCFPTAARVTRQDLLYVVPADEEMVFVMYEYQLAETAEMYRNVETMRVRDGLIREVQVYFGGKP